ncbi:MAG: PAS domain-containing protein [Alphaproteobacteria bacterium]|nr:PAS domain-containing protein [Alphaproteobacteria bacterium]
MSVKKHRVTRKKTDSLTNPEQELARIAISEDGMIAYVSPAFSDLTQQKPETLRGIEAESMISFSELLMQGPSITEIEAGLHKVYINGHSEPRNFHFDWLQAPDKKRYLIGSETTENKKPTKTEMKAFVEQLKNIETKKSSAGFSVNESRAFMDMSLEVMLIVSDLGEIVRANEQFFRLTGYSHEDLHRLHILDLFDEADKPYIRNTIQAFETETANVQAFEARILTKAGESRWMEWRQRLKGCELYCSGHDITEIKAHDEALTERERELLQAESIGRMGRWRWTIGDERMNWTPQIYSIFGVEDGQFAPTLDNMNAMVHREDIARVNQAFQRAIMTENDYDMEFRINRPDGEVRFIRCEGRCAFDDEGDVIALYGIMQDMTERMAHEHDLRVAKEAAEKAYASKTQFLANMSHELRTPLNAIIGFSEMVERQLLGPIGTEKYLEYIAGIRESGEHLLDLISDILDMSKIEAGKYELMIEELSILKVLQLGLHMMEGRAHEAGVKLSLKQEFDENLKMIADRRAVLQILLNLLSNAVKFTPEGGLITVKGIAREEYFSLKVIDNGIGIPANKLASVTKPFEQASSSYARDHEGSGLGLAISKELAEMHGGTLFVESTVGEGTTVTVRLPYDGSKAASS